MNIIRKATIATAVASALLASTVVIAKPLYEYQNAREFADAYFEVWNQKNYNAIPEFYDAKVIYRDLNLGTETKGVAELKQFIQKAVTDTPDLKFKTLDVVKQANDKLAIRWQMTGTSEGKAFSIEGASIMHLHQGKVIWNSDYYK